LCQLLGDSWRRLGVTRRRHRSERQFRHGRRSVEYDPDEVSLAEIYETIEDAGYGAVSDTVTIGISDMTCANCVQTNETALEDTPGVIAAEANFATDEAQVRYNPCGHVTRRALRRYRGRWLLAGP